MICVDGDIATFRPWSSHNIKLAMLTRMCMISGKCWYGSGIGASLLAYLCATGGDLFEPISCEEKERILLCSSICSGPKVDTASKTDRSFSHKVMLDNRSGDFYIFDSKTSVWIPSGNTGLALHLYRKTGMNKDTASGLSSRRSAGLDQSTYRSRRGDIEVCVRAQHRMHPILQTDNMYARAFLLNCTSKYDLDEKINSICHNKFHVLIDSSRGPMMIEYGNCIGSHFQMAAEYSESSRFVRKFMAEKIEELCAFGHVDQRYSTSAHQSLHYNSQFCGFYINPSLAYRSSAGNNRELVNGEKDWPNSKRLIAGRIISKRCLPLPAGHESEHSSFFHCSSHIPDDIVQNRSTMTHPTQKNEIITNLEAEENSGSKHEFVAQSSKATKDVATIEKASADPPEQKESIVTVRVAQMRSKPRPYCAMRRFAAMRVGKEAYYSIVNDGPYISPYEQELMEKQKNKLKWTAVHFVPQYS